MQIHTVDIHSLKPAEYNPRRMNEKQAKDLEDSIKEFDFAEPIIVNKHPGRENIIVGGHQRWYIAKKLEHQTIPIVYVDLPLEKEKRLNIRLNRNLGSWDYGLLAEHYGSDELMGLGFESPEVDKIFDMKDDDDDFDADAEAAKIKDPKAKLGDVYKLGEHRLMCGSSTDSKDMTKLMDGEKADMTFTDPPYNVNYHGRGKTTSRGIENDNMSSDDFRKFLNEAFALMAFHMKPEAGLYTCYASSTHREFEDAINIAGYQQRQQIIWVKNQASMGWGHYRFKHEPILYCNRKGHKSNFYGDRKQVTEWTEHKTDAELLDMIKKQIEKDDKGGSTTWRIKRSRNYDHPTQKPVQLCRIAIRNSSKRGEIVLDPFAGSGSVLIGAEQLKRRCYTMELDPTFVDVIIMRWEQFTGQTAELCQK